VRGGCAGLWPGGIFWATQRGGDAARRPYMDDVGMDMGGCAGLWLGGILDASLRWYDGLSMMGWRGERFVDGHVSIRK